MIGSAGLVLRIVYVLQARANDPLFYAPQMDALYHHQWASAIAQGIEFIKDAYFRAPLYPWFLGLVYKLFGMNLLAARLVQAVIGSASCGLLYLLTRRLFRENTARIAGFVLAAYPLAIYFDAELLIANLFVFLLLLGFVLLLRSREQSRQWWLPGLVFGLAVIARPNVLLFIAVLAVWLLFERSRPALNWQRAIQFCAAVAVVVLPVTVRNYVKSGKLVLVAWQGGTNFYIGNNPESDGITAIVPGTRSDWWGGYYDVKHLAEQAAGRDAEQPQVDTGKHREAVTKSPLKGAEIDQYWLRQGLKFWKEHPGQALGLLARKTYLWLSGYEVSNNRDIYFFTRYTWLGRLIFRLPLLCFPFGLLLPLGLVGLFLSRRRGVQLAPVYLFLLSFSASFIVFFVTARYRMPVVVLLIPFAVLGVQQLLAWRPLSRAERVTSLALLLSGLAFFNLNLARVPGTDRAQSHFLAAKALYDQGRRPDATRQLEQALEQDSAVNILSLEATLRTEKGQMDRAEHAAQAAVRLWPNVADAYGLAGNVYASQGRFDQAESLLQQVVKLDPLSVQAWNNLGNIAYRRQDLAAAREYYGQALAIDPNFTLALFHLGLVDYYEGRKAEAHERWRRVLQLEPGNSKARQALQQLR